MIATAVEGIDDAEYEAFLNALQADPGIVLGYHFPFYLRFLRDHVYPGSELRIVCARDEDGRLAGVMPGLHVRCGDMGVWLSLPYFGPNAGALADGENMGTIEALALAARGDADACGCDSLTICTPIAAPTQPYRKALGDDVIEQSRVTQVLAFSDDARESPWPRRVRSDLRRASRLNVEVEPVQSLEETRVLWDIYEENCRETGTPLKPWPHLARLYETAGEHGLFLVARCDSDIIAGLICFSGGRAVSYYLPCTRRSARPLQPGLALLDAALAYGRRRKCSLLNFEASPGLGSSVYRFKARCGGVDARYTVFVKLLKPQTMQRLRAIGRDGLIERFPYAFIIPYDFLD